MKPITELTVPKGDDMTTIHHGDCIETMNQMPPESVDAIVCDPPYGLSNTTPAQVADTITKWAGGDRGHVPTGRGFMGKSWDAFVPPPAVWDECLRVLKPGGHMVVFAGSRTHDLMGLSIRLAGFEMRDSLAYLYGSGFPKSHNVSKAIDKLNNKPLGKLREFGEYVKAARAEAGLTQADVNRAMNMPQGCGWWEGKGAGVKWDLHLPSRDTWAKLKTIITTLGDDFDYLIEWAEAERGVIGQGKSGKTYGMGGLRGVETSTGAYDVTTSATDQAKRYEGFGTALKPAFEPIVLARKPLAEKTVARNVLAHGTGAINVDACRIGMSDEDRAVVNNRSGAGDGSKDNIYQTAVGYRAPGEKFTAAPAGRWPANVLLDQHAAAWVDKQSGFTKSSVRPATGGPIFKSSQSFRGGGEQVDIGDRGHADQGGASRFFYTAKAPKSERPNVGGVQHPTVKPLTIMRWLIRLITPPGGTVLDPFAGSGTTIEAALMEGFESVGIEMEADYLPLIQHRIDRQAAQQKDT